MLESVNSHNFYKSLIIIIKNSDASLKKKKILFWFVHREVQNENLLLSLSNAGHIRQIISTPFDTYYYECYFTDQTGQNLQK